MSAVVSTKRPSTPPTTMPTPSVYYDSYANPLDQGDPAIEIQHPTPAYESEPKRYQLTDNAKLRPNDDDIVLAQNANAGVGRSGTWANGGGTFGPKTGTHSRNASLSERASQAANSLPEETNLKLSAAEKKDAQRLSKIIKAEGKAEYKQLKSALKELASLQRAQHKAASAESSATKTQSKAEREEQKSARAAQKATEAYLEAKARHERAVTGLKMSEKRLVMSKEQAQRTTEMVKRQAEEVDAMRERKAVDDREREVKLANLKAGIMAS